MCAKCTNYSLISTVCAYTHTTTCTHTDIYTSTHYTLRCLCVFSVRIEDFNIRVFKSTNKEEQQILDRGTLPTALQEVYRCVGHVTCEGSHVTLT